MRKTTPKNNGGRREPSILLHADNTDPDMLYFSRFNAFDPYLAFSVDGRRIGVTTAGEYAWHALFAGTTAANITINAYQLRDLGAVTNNFASWISGFELGEQTGFTDDFEVTQN